MLDPHEEIAALEREIEALSKRAGQCGKVSLLAKATVGAGVLLLVLTVIGALGRSPVALVAGIGALLGGIALHGSNRSTLDEIRAAIRERERRRANLIGHIDLRLVPS